MYTQTQEGIDVFVGIDVDKHSFAFTVKERSGMMYSKKIPAKPEQLQQFLKSRYATESVLCAYEAGPTGFHLYDYLNQQAQACIVIAPHALPKSAADVVVKNNRLDSQRIVQQLSAGNLHPIRVPEGPYRQLRHLVSLRHQYAAMQRTAKQRIRALLLFEHLQDPLESDRHWSNRFITALQKIPCSGAVQQRLESLLRDLAYAREQLAASERHLRLFVKEQPEIYTYVQYLKSIPGIGFIIAVSILGRSGNPALLQHVHELGAFVGVVPKEHSSGDVVHYGGITHRGDRQLRALLVEAAWRAIRFDRELEQFYQRIRARHGTKGNSQVAIVAVANKLTRIIYRVLKDKREFQSH